MKKAEPIFDLLVAIKRDAIEDQDWELLKTVLDVEGAAKIEIGNIKLKHRAKRDDNQGSLLERRLARLANP